MKLYYVVTAIAFLGAGCAETGQGYAIVPLFVAGTDVSEPILAAADVPVSIDRADLAFGPLYLCAGVTAGDLCDTARLEWLETVVVDTTVPEAVPAGALSGITGSVRSWMYDFGISSQLTREEPFILDAAQVLGDTSLVLEGRARIDGIEVPFVASVPIQQTDDTELGVPVVRKSTSEEFFHDVSDDESALLVRFDPAVWVRGIEFRQYVSSDVCTEGSPNTVCDGEIERTCDNGVELSNRDCGELGQVCVPNGGCADQLRIESDSEAYRSLRNALVSGARPMFDWDYVP